MRFLESRPYALMLFTALTCLASARAQDHALDEGAWALQFRVAGLVNLSDFQGGIISAKYHLADRRAVRFGLRLDASKSDRTDKRFDEVEATFPDTDPISQESVMERIQDNHSFSVGLQSQYVIYPSPQGQIKPFLGAGPRIDFSWSDREEVIDDEAPGGSGTHLRRESDTRGRTWTFGADGVVGAEWFPARRISFTAEYGVGISYATGSSTYEQQSTWTRDDPSGPRVDVISEINEQEQSSWVLGATGVRLGLSLYL